MLRLLTLTTVIHVSVSDRPTNASSSCSSYNRPSSDCSVTTARTASSNKPTAPQWTVRNVRYTESSAMLLIYKCKFLTPIKDRPTEYRQVMASAARRCSDPFRDEQLCWMRRRWWFCHGTPRPTPRRSYVYRPIYRLTPERRKSQNIMHASWCVVWHGLWRIL